MCGDRYGRVRTICQPMYKVSMFLKCATYMRLTYDVCWSDVGDSGGRTAERVAEHHCQLGGPFEPELYVV
jgi:hypothetical protein